MAQAIADADLVVARAGAGTIAEITAIGRASLLVPFPHAADDHQARNAQALASAGAAVCILPGPGRRRASGRARSAACSPTTWPAAPWPSGRARAAAPTPPAASRRTSSLCGAICRGASQGQRRPPPQQRGAELMFRGRVRHVHFVGIGGIGMSGLAEVLRTLEFDVSGSDLKPNDNTRRLEGLGRPRLLRPRRRKRDRRRRRRVLERDRAAQPRDRQRAGARDPDHPARRDARGADANPLRGHHRGLARQDDDDVARRDRPAGGGARSDRRRRRQGQRPRHQRAARRGRSLRGRGRRERRLVPQAHARPSPS